MERKLPVSLSQNFTRNLDYVQAIHVAYNIKNDVHAPVGLDSFVGLDLIVINLCQTLFLHAVIFQSTLETHVLVCSPLQQVNDFL